MCPEARLSTGRKLAAFSLAGAIIFGAVTVGRALADSRKFIVMLGISPKSGNSGDPNYPRTNQQPPVNFNEVHKRFFDPTNDPNTLSFREWWAEVSYGDVSVTGQTFDFISLPWRYYPTDDALPTEEEAERKLLYTDLDDAPDSRSFSYGVGEAFTEFEQAFHRFRIIFDEGGVIGVPVEGVHDGVWTPGERFRDLNGSGQYTYVEYEDRNGNGSRDPNEPGFDGDGNGAIDTRAEPFEDYMRYYDVTAPRGRRWVKMTDAYIDHNYPGDPRFLKTWNIVTNPGGRTVNGTYDGPDRWTERIDTDNPSIKLFDTGFPVAARTTSEPGWFATFWADRYGTPPPSWSSRFPGGRIPRIELFDPAAPDPDDPPEDSLREFEASQDGAGSPFPVGTYPTDPEPGSRANVQPDTSQDYYDGPVEFDDLASSIYHDTPSGERWTNGDLRLGEVTSPVGFTIYGDTSDGRSGPIPSAGPLATRIFGERGNPAGNQLNIEMITWRNNPDEPNALAKPRQQLDPGRAIWNSEQFVTTQTSTPKTYRQMYQRGFRDLNLDGLIDPGETVPWDTRTTQFSNYAVSMSETEIMLGPYPFNRRRLTEDMVEANDPTVNFNQFTEQDGPYARHIYGTTLIGPAAAEPRDTNIREFAPTLIAIKTEDNASPFLFAELVGSLGDENGNIKSDYNMLTTVHEYGHTWEGWPDLYDEVVNDIGDIIRNQPWGTWDIMSNQGRGAHPAPFLKQNVNIGTGQFHGGIRQHSPWIVPTDLRKVLTPGQPQTIIIPPCEFQRNNAFYYFDNVAHRSVTPTQPNRRERFYFWVVSNAIQSFHRNLAGFGMLIGHIDLGAGGGAFPSQNQNSTGSFWTYNLLQADGLRELEANFELDLIGPIGFDPQQINVGDPNDGDAGDPFPGATNKRIWNKDSEPTSMFHDELESGLRITDIQLVTGGGRAVTFLWLPREVPSLAFIRPPGGESVACGPPNCLDDCEIYRLAYEAFDFFGGTRIEFFRDSNDSGYDGTPLTFDLVRDVPGECGGSSTTLVPKQPGSIEDSVPIDVSTLADGKYWFYARLRPGANSQGITDPKASAVYPSPANQGNGTLQVINVDIAKSRVETWTVFMLPGGTVGNELWQVQGTSSGIQVGKARTGQNYTSDNGRVSLKVTAGSRAFAVGDRFDFLTTGLTAYSGPLRVQRGQVFRGPAASFTANPATGNAPLTVTFVSNSTDPDEQPMTHRWNFGDGQSTSGLDLRVVTHEYPNPGDYTVTLTVINPLAQQDSLSKVVRVAANERPTAVILANPTTGEAPITVNFDGRQSFDPEGSELTLEWNFGDGSNLVSGSMADVGTISHVYQQRGDWTATLTVTDDRGGSGSASVLISLTGNAAPVAAFTATPNSGGAPLTVNFDASNSTDEDGDPLTFSWDFGDGSPEVSGVTAQHTYQAIGVYTVTLTASDGEAADTATAVIEVINLPPVITLTANPTSGSPPLKVNFDASGTFDPEGGALSYNWTFGDGGSDTSGPVVSHTYQSVGSFTARLTVTDPQGAASTEVRGIRVSVPGNRPPAVSIAADPDSGNAPLTVEFNLSGTSDPDGDPVKLTLDFGDGNVLVNLLPTSLVNHTYVNGGTYTVVAVGSDGKGQTAQADVVITVTGGGPVSPPGPTGPCGIGLAQMTIASFAGLVLMSFAGRSRRRRPGASGRG